jgi:hypothetical protein
MMVASTLTTFHPQAATRRTTSVNSVRLSAPFVLRVSVRKMPAGYHRGRRAEQCIADGVDEDVVHPNVPTSPTAWGISTPRSPVGVAATSAWMSKPCPILTPPPRAPAVSPERSGGRPDSDLDSWPSSPARAVPESETFDRSGFVGECGRDQPDTVASTSRRYRNICGVSARHKSSRATVALARALRIGALQGVGNGQCKQAAHFIVTDVRQQARQLFTAQTRPRRIVNHKPVAIVDSRFHGHQAVENTRCACRTAAMQRDHLRRDAVPGACAVTLVTGRKDDENGLDRR